MEEKEFYIDANIFIFAYSDDKEKGVICRKIMNMVIDNKIKAFTSVLTFDEIFYKIKRLKDKETALMTTKLFLNLKNLIFIDVNLNILAYAYSILKNYNLNPRDAIHLSCALSKGIRNIISDDEDFNKIKEIKRFKLKDFQKL